MFGRLSKFIAARPRSFDAFIALLWTGLSLTADTLWASGNSLWWIVPSFLVMGIALYWRRRNPVPVFLIHAGVILAMTIVDVTEDVPISILCGVYSLAAWSTNREVGIRLFAGFILLGVGSTLVTGDAYLVDALTIALFLAIAWLAGDLIRTRRAYHQSLLDRAERAEALQDSMAHQAVAEERTRIARELHDVVAHSMSLMVVQAGAARRLVDKNPERATEAIEAIENVGRNSLDEMRRILGVLRSDNEQDQTAPQPDLQALDELCHEFSAAGLPVALAHQGDPRPLPASLELTAYRIVQESLTNSLKHAGACHARVMLDWHDESLAITVEDDGRGRAGSDTKDRPASSRKGLIGMRERIAAFGGDFDARPRLSGGWRVEATLPISTEALS